MLSRTYSAVSGWVSRHPFLSLGLAICSLAFYSGALAAAGVLAQKQGYPKALRDRLVSMVGELWNEGAWKERITGLHTLEMARVHIGDGLGHGGGLEEAGGNIIFASAKGRLGYLDANHRVHSLDITVPMNLKGLRKDPHYGDALYALDTLRVADLLTVETAPGQFTLYVSHHVYTNPECMQFKVSSIDIAADARGVRPLSSEWKDVFTARPKCIRHKDRSWAFVGEQAGGRLALLDKDHLLLSVGDHQFDGFNDAWDAPQDPKTDLGKIILIDLKTHTSRIYASGLRNPQGLTVTRSGEIWETEHGPQGGDEVNFIRDGANYGWPMVTYGMNYGYPRRYWPFDPTPGAHDGYTKPALAFVPSVGISSIVEPSLKEFPDWRHILVAGTLRSHQLLLLRTEGDRIVYSEPVSADQDRVRDIISLHNGELVYLTDEGDLVFVRNRELHKHDKQDKDKLVVVGLEHLSQPFPEELPERASDPKTRGRHMFLNACARCHALDGGVGAGPPLNGVVGRRIGSVPGYDYSDALARHGGTWTRDLLTSFLTDPDRHFHGTKMPIAPISWVEVPNIIEFLKTTREGGAHAANEDQGKARQGAAPTRHE